MRKKVIAFLNTSLGIWLLSSVLLGAVSFSYTRLSNRFAEDAKRSNTVLRLKIEVAQRANQVGAQIADIKEAPDYDKTKPNTEIASLITMLMEPPNKPNEKTGWTMYAAYPEYKERPLRSLLTELRIMDKPNNESINKLLAWITFISPQKLKVRPSEELVNSLAEEYDVKYWGPQL